MALKCSIAIATAILFSQSIGILVLQYILVVLLKMLTTMQFGIPVVNF